MHINVSIVFVALDLRKRSRPFHSFTLQYCRTATAEGKQMAQVLSTFSRLEQSRFEAFRKAAFPGDAISKYVAHCLIHEQHRPISVGGADSAAAEPPSFRTRIPGAEKGPYDRDGKAKARLRHLRPSAHYRRRKVLSELVAPGEAQDITVVVSTLAKEYAQRLVLAARRYATERTSKAKQRREAAGEEDSGSEEHEKDEDIAISPEDLLKAHADRQARGLDPGFFLQGPRTHNAQATETSLFLADPDSHQRYSLSRSVALAAQEEYDKDQKERDEREKGDQTADGNDGEDDDDAMDTDNDGDGGVEIKKAKSFFAESSEEEIEDEKHDPSEQAMKLFALHVNRMIARQNGITVVTSDDEGTSLGSQKKEDEKEETKPPASPSSSTPKEEQKETSASTESEKTVTMDISPGTTASGTHQKETEGVTASDEVGATTTSDGSAKDKQQIPQTQIHEDTPAAAIHASTTESTSLAADNNSDNDPDAKKENEIIMIDDD